MSVPPVPHRRTTWPRALLTLLVLLTATLTLAALTGLAPPPPPAALSTETGGEIQQDVTDTALRLPTRHATRLPTRHPHTAVSPPRTSGAPKGLALARLHPHVPTPRSVVLRC